MLTNKQKSFLKSMANPLKAIFQVGKEGISENLIKSIQDSLVAHELIKIHMLKTCPIGLNELAIEISRLTNCEVVQMIGKSLVIYKANKKPKIQLPKD